MTRNRLMVAAGLLIMIAGLAGAHLMTGPINEMRSPENLQLTVNPDVLANADPATAFAQTALGSFRGLYIDFLWMRANKMKQEGKFYEANELARQITTLQSRFPQVWAFNAWNMAYNISVATHTPDERWMWVQNGIRLLRDEGIPANPTSLLLYKELAWIYQHKIGDYSDDMHWVYKENLAKLWTEILGRRPEAVPTEEVVAWFAPIAEMDQAYFDTETGRWDRQGFLDDHPGVAGQIAWLVERGVDPWKPEFVRTVGRMQAMQGSFDLTLVTGTPNYAKTESDQAVYEWLNQPGGAEAREKLIDYLRARHIRDEQGLDPRFMLALMRGEPFVKPYADAPVDQLPDPSLAEPTPLPIDWRHPAAHALYWAALGIERTNELKFKGEKGDFNTLATDRQVTHALQKLNRTGLIVYDYYSGNYDQMPDTRYYPGFEKATFIAGKHLAGEGNIYGTETDAPASFRAGHENLLIFNVNQAYFAGDIDLAEQLYQKLRENFTPSSDPPWTPGGIDRATRYTHPLKDFVYLEFTRNQDFTQLDEARGVIYRSIRMALNAYSNNKREAGKQYIEFARYLHQRYQEQQDFDTLGEGRNRMALPSFRQMVVGAVLDVMHAPLVSPVQMYDRARIWRLLDLETQQRVYGYIKDSIIKHATEQGWPVERMFPEPEGWRQYYRPPTRGEQDEGDGQPPSTIRRN